MTPTEFDDYLYWPGNRHNFSGEAGTYGVGTRVEDTPEMVAEPTGAATNDEHSSSEWWCWNKITRVDWYLSCTMNKKLVLSFCLTILSV